MQACQPSSIFHRSLPLLDVRLLDAWLTMWRQYTHTNADGERSRENDPQGESLWSANTPATAPTVLVPLPGLTLDGSRPTVTY